MLKFIALKSLYISTLADTAKLLVCIVYFVQSELVCNGCYRSYSFVFAEQLRIHKLYKKGCVPVLMPSLCCR